RPIEFAIVEADFRIFFGSEVRLEYRWYRECEKAIDVICGTSDPFTVDPRRLEETHATSHRQERPSRNIATRGQKGACSEKSTYIVHTAEEKMEHVIGKSLSPQLRVPDYVAQGLHPIREETKRVAIPKPGDYRLERFQEKFLLIFPVLVVSIAVEWFYRWYRWNVKASISAIITAVSCGILTGFMRHGVLGGPFLAMTKFQTWKFPEDSPFSWFLSLLLLDFAFYLHHRASHSSSLLWTSHRLHHICSRHHLPTGFRQGVLELLSYTAFTAPLALLGVPVKHFLILYQIHFVHQFYIHVNVELPFSIPLVDAILNTPHRHRIHHDVLNKNFGGVFLIWDHIFGTFQSEARPEYVAKSIVSRTRDAIWMQTKAVMRLCHLASLEPRWSRKFQIFTRFPEEGNSDCDQVPQSPTLRRIIRIPIWCQVYMLLHSAIFLYFYHLYTATTVELDFLTHVLSKSLLTLSLVTAGAIMDRRDYSGACESLRCLLVYLVLQRVASTYPVMLLKTVFWISGVLWVYLTQTLWYMDMAVTIKNHKKT
ncbi:unnamed protein product, partial [Darwinula stevensoni]